MKRRELLHLLPVSAAGLALSPYQSSARERPRPAGAGGGETLAQEYQRKVRDMLVRIRETQSENLLEASYAVARTVERGNTCWCNWNMGHGTRFELFPGRDGLPELFTPGYDSKKLRNGDLYLTNRGPINLKDRADKDFFVIGAPVPWSSDAGMADLIVRDTAKHRNRPHSDLWIETFVTTVGAVVRVPGMPAPVGPVSGILGIVLFWMIAADACRILAREGKAVPVGGDEPRLSGDGIEYVSLHDPLMDDYFDRVLMQMEMIGAETGDIREIASMAVDSVLAGGKVYGYSRLQTGICVEAQTRRGGLAMTRGVFEENGKVVDYQGNELKGSPNDLVIMGIHEPDNPADLAALDSFRRMNMKIASIGPMTRDIKIPEGRTVPKETDVHVGRMCDAYGLYAVPGFERKICPTSGALQMQLYWVTVMEIVDEVIRRTDGNVPGVFMSAAIKGGTEHMHRMNAVYEERGY
ncbi:MAG: hypothetical protein J7M24_02605 [Candidatus Latescibacteria bacterium]|nr:hypothetical protein [Candidatus Latescibacterota bacterium]